MKNRHLHRIKLYTKKLPSLFLNSLLVACIFFHGTSSTSQRDLLIDALKQNSYYDVKDIITLNPFTLALPDKEGVTPLMIAAKCCSPDVVELLLEKAGRLISNRDNQQRTAAMYAAQKNTCDVIELFFKYPQTLDDQDQYQHTPIVHAFIGKNFLVFTRIAQEKSLKNALTPKNREFILQSCITNNDIKALRFLKNLGMSFTSTNNQLLISAILKKNIDIITLFLNNEADPYKADQYGHSAIFYVIAQDNSQIFELFIEKGFLFNKPNLLMNAIYSNAHAILCSFLYHYPDLINSHDSEGNSTLMIALKTKNAPAFKQLFMLGADSMHMNNKEECIFSESYKPSDEIMQKDYGIALCATLYEDKNIFTLPDSENSVPYMTTLIMRHIIKNKTIQDNILWSYIVFNQNRDVICSTAILSLLKSLKNPPVDGIRALYNAISNKQQINAQFKKELDALKHSNFLHIIHQKII